MAIALAMQLNREKTSPDSRQQAVMPFLAVSVVAWQSLSSTFSSFKIRQTRIGMCNRKTGTAHQGPSAIGVSRYMTKNPKYIGWRMMEYGPVVMTF